MRSVSRVSGSDFVYPDHSRPRPPRGLWRSVLIWTSPVLVLVLVVVLAFTLPAIGPVSGKALSYSVGAQVNGDQISLWSCAEEGVRVRSCLISQGSYRIEYRVNLHGRCWNAVRVGFGGEEASPVRASGCVKLSDQI